MLVALHVKVKLPKRRVGYNQGVLPSAEARVMNLNNWRRQQIDSPVEEHNQGVLPLPMQFLYLIPRPILTPVVRPFLSSIDKCN